MTELPHITKSPENVSCSLDGDNAFAPMSVRCRRVMVDYLSDLLTPAFNQLRAAYGIAPEPPRPGPPVTPEQAKAAADEYWALEALRAEQREAELAEWKALMEAGAEKPRRQHKPRSRTLAKVAEQFRKADIDARLEQKPDGTIVVVTGKPDPVEPEDPWPLDDFRTEETKQ